MVHWDDETRNLIGGGGLALVTFLLIISLFNSVQSNESSDVFFISVNFTSGNNCSVPDDDERWVFGFVFEDDIFCYPGLGSPWGISIAIGVIIGLNIVLLALILKQSNNWTRIKLQGVAILILGYLISTIISLIIILDWFGPCNKDNINTEILWCKNQVAIASSSMFGAVLTILIGGGVVVLFVISEAHAKLEEKKSKKEEKSNEDDKFPLLTESNRSSEIIGERKKVGFPDIVADYALNSIVIDKSE